MLRAIFAGTLILGTLLIAVTFAWLNPGQIDLDLGFLQVQIATSVAFAITFALGWLFGLLSSGLYVMKLMRERSHLRRQVRAAEQEVKAMRSMPEENAN